MELFLVRRPPSRETREERAIRSVLGPSSSGPGLGVVRRSYVGVAARLDPVNKQAGSRQLGDTKLVWSCTREATAR